MVLLYFYEGNDLDDNLRDIRTRYLGHYDPARVRDPEYFRRFMDARTAEACAHCEVADNLVFGQLFSGRTPQAPPIEGSLKPFLAACSMPEATPSPNAPRRSARATTLRSSTRARP